MPIFCSVSAHEPAACRTGTAAKTLSSGYGSCEARRTMSLNTRALNELTKNDASQPPMYLAIEIASEIAIQTLRICLSVASAGVV